MRTARQLLKSTVRGNRKRAERVRSIKAWKDKNEEHVKVRARVQSLPETLTEQKYPHEVTIQSISGNPKKISDGYIKVDCDCGDFIYRWEYALAIVDAAEIQRSNGEPPDDMNPNLRPSMCISEGELVPTDRGIIPIEEVKEGDKVETLQGKKRVLASSLTYESAEIIKVTTSFGRELNCTPDHPVLVVRNNEFVWLNAGDLNSDDTVVVSTGYSGYSSQSIDHEPGYYYFYNITKEHKLNAKPNRVDSEVLNESEVSVAHSQMIPFNPSIIKNEAIDELYENMIEKADNSELISVHNYSENNKNEFIPSTNIITNNVKKSGLYELGSINGYPCKIICATEENIIKANENAIKNKIKKSIGNRKKFRNHNRVSKEVLNDALDKLPDSNTKRMYEVALDPNIVFESVRSVEGNGKGRVYDLEVENVHHFLANGVVVHNCKHLYKVMSSAIKKNM